MGWVTAPSVAIETVPIRDAGNAPDARYGSPGFGAVAYAYRIGTYEVTNAQYRAFLNAKAAVGDPYGLYSAGMFGVYGGIARVGSGTLADPWVYVPKDNDSTWDSRPVNFVSFWDAARFCNWLRNGQGDGDTESGAYLHVGSQSDFARLPGAIWVIPTEDEWYKAAYYKGAGLDSGYWDYATRSDTLPDNNIPANDSGNSANYFFALGASPYSTSVGAYGLSRSAYGTFDQNGNVWEWNETALTPSSRGMRGSSWNSNDEWGLHASERGAWAPSTSMADGGFRVAFVPEPAGGILLFAAITFTGRRARWTAQTTNASS